LHPVAIENSRTVRLEDHFWSWVRGREIWTQHWSGRGGAGGRFWVLSSSWQNVFWMLSRELSTTASRAMAPESGFGLRGVRGKRLVHRNRGGVEI
jgi:hypothetical protein